MYFFIIMFLWLTTRKVIAILTIKQSAFLEYFFIYLGFHHWVTYFNFHCILYIRNYGIHVPLSISLLSIRLSYFFNSSWECWVYDKYLPLPLVYKYKTNKEMIKDHKRCMHWRRGERYKSDYQTQKSKTNTDNAVVKHEQITNNSMYIQNI